MTATKTQGAALSDADFERTTQAELSDDQLSVIWRNEHGAKSIFNGFRAMRAAIAADRRLTAEQPVVWEGAEEWEPLAWELCANECGEDACNELIWEGGAVPEPWGERWLKYEDEAKRLIAMVRKYAPAPVTAEQGGADKPTDEEIGASWDSITDDEAVADQVSWDAIRAFAVGMFERGRAALTTQPQAEPTP